MTAYEIRKTGRALALPVFLRPDRSAVQAVFLVLHVFDGNVMNLLYDSNSNSINKMKPVQLGCKWAIGSTFSVKITVLFQVGADLRCLLRLVFR